MAAGEQAPADRHFPDRNLGLTGAAVCSVELTEVEVLGQTWWTLGFEAGGRGALGGIKRTAAVVFAEPLPTASAFRAEEACSYAEWIHELGHPGGTR